MKINGLKKLFVAMLLIAACLSCTNEIVFTDKVILDEMIFSADGGVQTKLIELCSDDWSYSDLDVDWVSVNRDGDNLVVTVEPNETSQIRSAYCFISAEYNSGDNYTSETLYLDIIQDGE